MKKIKLAKTEKIIAIEPKYCAGPGWANSPLYVHILDYSNNKYRSIALQPKEQSEEIMLLFKVTATANEAMLYAVNKMVITPKAPAARR